MLYNIAIVVTCALVKPEAAGAVDVQLPAPSDVRRLPAEPGVVNPVPPFAGTKVPANVIVPEVVIGPPEVDKPVVPPETATLETVPSAPAFDANNATVPELFLA